MKERRLSRTGLSVSEIGHGLWGMGSWSGSDDDESLAALRLSADNGCTFYDTAWAYGEGRSDALLGRLVSERGDGALVAASKVPPFGLKFPASPDDAYEDVFPTDYVREMTDKIRSALNVDSIPLLQFHVWDDHWADDPAFRNTIESLKSSGTIASFGISLNRWEPWNGLAAVATGLVDTVQVIYNIFDQAPEDELFPACEEMNVGLIARVPLDEGSLGGGLTLDTRFPADDWRSGYFGPENLGPTVDRVDALKQVVPAEMTLPEMALRFILSDSRVSTMIVGMRKAEHVRANLAASEKGPLPSQLLEELRAHRWDRVVTPWAN